MDQAFSQFIARFNQFGTVSVADTIDIFHTIGWYDIPEHIVVLVATNGEVDFRGFNYLLSLRIEVLKEMIEEQELDGSPDNASV